jgi:CubicO group peptidase (beta-lactamase class C family)
MQYLKFYPGKILKALLASIVLFSVMNSGLVLSETDPYSGVRMTASEKAETLIKNYGVNSVQYAVLSKGKIIVSDNAGVYSKKNNQPISNNTLYGIGSTSKMFTTASVMQLVDQGKIILDEPIITYLPEFKMADERYRKITVRMLLNHSSGLMGSYWVNGFALNDPNTMNHDTILTELASQQLKADPGAFSVYCNDGFILAELILENVSGMSYTEYLENYIAKPLNLSATFTPQSDFNRDRLARTYLGGTETPVDAINMIGTGGIYSTAEDLCRFGEIFINNPQNLVANTLLTDGARSATMQKEYARGIWPAQNDSAFNYGLGWDAVDTFPFNHYGTQALKKGGDSLLYHCSFIVLPEQNMVAAVLTSGGSSMYAELIAESLLLETMLTEGKIDRILPPVTYQAPVAAAVPKEIQANSGTYANSSQVMSVAIHEDGRLIISSLSNSPTPEQTYQYTGKGTFSNSEGSKRLTFVKESNSRIYMQIVQYTDVPGLGQYASTEYFAQKIEPSPIETSIQQAWDQRNQTTYFIVNENYSSQWYPGYSLITTELNLTSKLPGYVLNYKILDQNRAQMDIQVPVMQGRDTSALEIVKKNNTEYLLKSGWVYQSEKDIVDMYAEGEAICTIQPDGYARWYKINAADAGKTMTVKLPPKGSFGVYEGKDCIYYSTVFGNRSVIIPQKGMVVFVGEAPGSKFEINCRFQK